MKLIDKEFTAAYLSTYYLVIFLPLALAAIISGFVFDAPVLYIVACLIIVACIGWSMVARSSVKQTIIDNNNNNNNNNNKPEHGTK